MYIVFPESANITLCAIFNSSILSTINYITKDKLQYESANSYLFDGLFRGSKTIVFTGYPLTLLIVTPFEYFKYFWFKIQ
jgi:hypothetical protein